MDMTYSESAEGILIDRARIARELADHGLAGFEDECIAEIRPRRGGLYDAGDVLRWLGY